MTRFARFLIASFAALLLCASSPALAVAKFWVGGTGTWDGSLTTDWSLTSGGVGGAPAPTSSDAVTFDSSSGSGTVTTAAGATAASITQNSATLGLTLGADLTTPGTFTLTQGAIDTGGFNLSCQFFSSANSNTRSVAFGATGKITITGNNASVLNMSTVTNFTYTGTSNVTFSYSGATGTRTVQFATGQSEANAMNYFITAGTDIFHFPIARSVDFTGFSGTMADTAAHSLYGSLTLSATMTMASGSNGFFVRGTAGPYTVRTNGVTLNSQITFGSSSAPGSWSLSDALTSTAGMTFQTGTLSLNNQAVSVATFSTSGSNVRTLTMGSSVIHVTGSGASAWTAATSTNLTVTASTATISMDSASAKTFAGGGKTWPTLNQGGAGDLTVTGANQLTSIANSSQPAKIILPINISTITGSLPLAGTAGNLVTLASSSAGTRAPLMVLNNAANLSYVSLQDISARSLAPTKALTSSGNVDAGNNSGVAFYPQHRSIGRHGIY